MNSFQHRLGVVAILILLFTPPLRSDPPAKDEKRFDPFGDPLPPGARLRLGRTFVPHNTAVWSVAYSPDSRLLLSTAYRKAQLWDLATGKEIRQFQGHDVTVITAAFSPDGQRLATMDSNTLCLWETTTGKLLRRLERYPNGKNQAVLGPTAF